jgi:three-Cys-motif partner protein
MERAAEFIMMDHPLLFDELPHTTKKMLVFRTGRYPLWTKNKANLISRYLRYFVFITKHGAYIDGFAAPQASQDDGGIDNWSAKMVLKSEPKLLRDFWLCDIDSTGVDALRSMVDGEPKVKGRNIDILLGDFNNNVGKILESGRIKQTTAAFCLLDQRTFECHWSTVEKLAAYKIANKIELFYFLGTGWLPRALAAVKGAGRDQVTAWWGGDDWENLREMKGAQRADAFCCRFKENLGYKYAYAWPIYSNGHNGRVMYHMIHCTDHDEAPKLMARAYRFATTPLETAEQLELALGKFPQ